MERYDQSVTCLADDPQNLAIRSNKRHTPGTLSQTKKQTISTHIMHRSNSNEKSNQKVQLKNSGLQKESNRTKQRKSNGERNKLRLLIWI